MFKSQTRRQFLNQTTLGTATAGLGSLSALLPFSPATANDALITPDMIRFGPTMEPLVRLMETTPRDRCVPVFIDQLRRGLSYRRFLSALYLAALRLSKAHHTVFRVHAVHRMSLDARHEDRLLPLFWALDGLKRRLDKYPSPPVKPIEGKLPTGEAALIEFDDALRGDDRERAERAVAAVVRAKGGGLRWNGFGAISPGTGGTKVTKRSRFPTAGGRSRQLVGNTPSLPCDLLCGSSFPGKVRNRLLRSR